MRLAKLVLRNFDANKCDMDEICFHVVFSVLTSY